MSITDNYALIRSRIEENQINQWRCYQSMQYLSELDDLRTFVAGYDNRELTAEEYGTLMSVEAHIGRLEELRADLLKADLEELKKLYGVEK